MFEELNSIKSSKKDLKNFGVTIGFILLMIGAFLFIREKDSCIYFFSIGSILIIVGVITPVILKPIYKIWMIFAVIIGWIMTRVILSILFFSIITTIGIFTRLIGKDFLNLKSKNNESYWNIRNKEYELNQDYEKQF
tara:strand:+ start:3269 stop:3679 length:411 start_codon:yes stop_codon:yes gene_type:complete